MKTRFLFLWLGLSVGLLLPILHGCKSKRAPDTQQTRTLGHNLQGAQTDIGEASDVIDDTVKDTPQQPAVNVQTSRIREALKAAPASEIIAALEGYISENSALKKENLTLKKKVQDAADSVWRTVQLWGSGALYFVAIGALVLAAFRAKAAIATGAAIVEGIKSTMTLVTLSATCFTVARFMAAWWFWYACAGIILAFLAYVGYLAVMERKGKAAVNALTPIRKALDKAYDDAAPDVQQDLQARVFDPIAEEMKKAKPGARKFLHINRAEQPA